MLTPGMKRNFDAGVACLTSTPGVQTVLRRESNSDDNDNAPPRPLLARTSAENFIADHALREEVFGPACLVVRVKSADEIVDGLNAVGASATVTLWGAENDSADVRRITRCATQIAGRVLFSGVPTGVAVTRSQQHGGPLRFKARPRGWLNVRDVPADIDEQIACSTCPDDARDDSDSRGHFCFYTEGNTKAPTKKAPRSRTALRLHPI
jgi:hypothetical protein